jgi:hypothetical protein
VVSISYSLTGLAGMGTVTDEEHTKDSGLFQMPMPASGSSSQILIDIFGTTRNIVIKGTFASGDSGYANVAAFIVALDALQNGAQTSKSFVSDKSGVTYTVLVTSAIWTSEPGAVNQVNYTINMVEGTA